jgi:hypothetical protein
MNITKQFLEQGYIIHNDTQISIEIEGMIFLYTVENTAQFVIDNKMDEIS